MEQREKELSINRLNSTPFLACKTLEASVAKLPLMTSLVFKFSFYKGSQEAFIHVLGPKS